MDNRIPRYCIVCGRDLGPLWKEWRERCDSEEDCLSKGPNNGVYWRTSGNYGSVMLDLNATIEGYLCDECLAERSDRLYVVQDWDEIHEEMAEACMSVRKIPPPVTKDKLTTYADYDECTKPNPVIRPDMDDPAFADVVELQKQLHDEWDRNIHLHQRCAELLRMNVLLLRGIDPVEARRMVYGNGVKHAHLDVTENDPHYSEIFVIEKKRDELMRRLIEPETEDLD